MAAFRLFFPHAAVFGSILKWLRIVPSEWGQLLWGTLRRAAQAACCHKATCVWFFRRLRCLAWPHAPCARPCVAGPKTERGIEAAAVPISCRYSRDLGVLQLTIILVVLGYGGVCARRLAQATGVQRRLKARAKCPPAFQHTTPCRRRCICPGAPAVVTPIILPFGLLYFAMWWPIWRYQML